MANHFNNLHAFNQLVKTNGVDLAKWDDKQPVLQLILHTADISNPTRPLNVATEWTNRVLQECFTQGDQEPNFNALAAIDSELYEPLSNIERFQAHWEAELA